MLQVINCKFARLVQVPQYDGIFHHHAFFTGRCVSVGCHSILDLPPKLNPYGRTVERYGTSTDNSHFLHFFLFVPFLERLLTIDYDMANFLTTS